MTEITYCYGLAELDSDGERVVYLPGLGEGYIPGTVYRLTPDAAQAWRFASRESAREYASVLNSNPPYPHFEVVELPAL